ncbi:MAG: hypothetical protein AABW85_00290 [archaeon]
MQKQNTVTISQGEYDFLKKKSEIADKLLEQANAMEIELVNRKLDQINIEIKQGKRKLLNSEQALGEYAKYLK